VNPLLDDKTIEFLLYDVLDAEGLLALPKFAEHSRETFDMVISNARKLARTALFPVYREMDQSPRFEGGHIALHPKMRELYPKLLELGLAPATRGEEVGGQSLPMMIDSVAQTYLCAANLGVASFVILCRGPAHLIEAFGSDALKKKYMEPLYAGEMTGTMALTEPHAGSSLADLTTTATPTSNGEYLVRGQKIFISGGDHDLTDNIVHLTLARIEGAPAGTKGISLFAIPKMRDGKPNDVHVAGMVHKIGWKALPSLIMSFGEQNACRAELVGEANQGLTYMFQMMNEARIGVGLAATATATVAYHEALEYARTRTQGRALGQRGGPQIPIMAHADVRRMLLRQKAICEGSLALVMLTARYADVAETGDESARLMLDLLTPITKTFPAEKGFESNALAVQIHGGYGYSSEYLPEAWLRDQKLNTLHEGTTGIQSMDLLGRKVMAKDGAALRLLLGEVERAIGAAKTAGVPEALVSRVAAAAATIADTTMKLAAVGMGGDPESMMRHSVDYLEMMSTFVIAWLWLRQATAAKTKTGAFYDGKLRAAQYFIETDLPKIGHLAHLCVTAEDSYARMTDEMF
jgi:butyryl-CoA dehydrogenase